MTIWNWLLIGLITRYAIGIFNDTIMSINYYRSLKIEKTRKEKCVFIERSEDNE